MPRRIAIVGGGISGLGTAWALHHHPDRFDFRLFEAQEQIGGNAVTVDMPQDDGSSIPYESELHNHIIQGKRRTWHCGAHTLINSQETCLITGLAAARQLGAGLLRARPLRLAVPERPLA